MAEDDRPHGSDVEPYVRNGRHGHGTRNDDAQAWPRRSEPVFATTTDSSTATTVDSNQRESKGRPQWLP